MCPRHDQMSRTEDWLYDVRASDEEIAAYYATAWLGYLSQEDGTAGEDCITIGCISLEVRHDLDILGNWQTDQSIFSCRSFWMFILAHCPSRETFDEIPNWLPTPLIYHCEVQSALTYNRQTISGTWWSIRWYHHHSGVCVHTGCLIYHQELKIISLNTTQLTCNREGPANETSTNDIVSKMTNFIKENSFELTFEGMNIKFTSLQVFFGGDDYFKQNC